MSGHNKWSKIKHKKAASDASKSKTFGKLARMIAVESKRAGGDESAPSLRAAIEKARVENMPKENIERAIAKGAGGESENLEMVVYEAYVPGGSALIIEALTDNRNRTASEIKHILSKHGVELASPGSAAWAFEKTDGIYKPKTTVKLADTDREKVDLLSGALAEHDDVDSVYTNAQ